MTNPKELEKLREEWKNYRKEYNEEHLCDIPSGVAGSWWFIKFQQRDKLLVERLLKEFNEKFRYLDGEPMEGSLKLNHNNVRDFINNIEPSNE